MSLKIVGISASPREKGNSALLLREAIAGAESAGGAVEYISLRDKKIAACVECNSCSETGRCRIEDDFQDVLAKMLAADRLIFATPIFFMGVPAQAKALIDRCQWLWVRKYAPNANGGVNPTLQESPIGQGRDRRAMVIAVGGTKSTKMFECIRLTMKYFFDVLDMHYAANLFVNKLDAAGAVLNHPTAMQQARRLGEELVTDKSAPPEKPVDTELT